MGKKIKDVMNYLESIAPRSLQESYDNSGLIVGDKNAVVTGVILSLDVTEEVIEEAVENGCNLIVAHHPIIFKGLKKLTGSNYVERTVAKAIKLDVAIYAIHTNLDNVLHGVNHKIADKLGLKNLKILSPGKDQLLKIVSFVPQENTKALLGKLHEAGAGVIGDYNHCSFRVTGTGRFQGSENTNPHLGNKNYLEEVTEDRIELIFPSVIKGAVLNALHSSHPYEEVAYYLNRLENIDSNTGSGMIGDLNQPTNIYDFMDEVKKSFNLKIIKHTPIVNSEIKKVAICGGSGGFLMNAAKSKQADVFITADIKYHEYFDAENQITVLDIGHYESEVFTKDLLHELLSEKFNTFALRLSETNTNPVSYY